ncbi:hypothetical protein MIR68_009990 [Amoeboaphelidium protococcarum]|nr:hypothetical protein MIR68_009990 [Amoeboaphelidium protococcarum]
MPYAQIVIGTAGSGKSTYCQGVRQFIKALPKQYKKRRVILVNLDPANELVNQPIDQQNGESQDIMYDVDIRDLITLEDVMDKYQLGSNGSLLYCMDFLYENKEWLMQQLESAVSAVEDEQHQLNVTAPTDDINTPATSHTNANDSNKNDTAEEEEEEEEDDDDEDARVHFIIDFPGQVELFTDTNMSTPMLIQWLQREMDLQVCIVSLTDVTHCADSGKYISSVLLSLRMMLCLEFPFINVMSKFDLISTFKDDLAFDVDYYTQVGDTSNLLDHLKQTKDSSYHRLNESLVGLIEDFKLVTFQPLSIDNKDQMLDLQMQIDRATGCGFTSYSLENPTSITDTLVEQAQSDKQQEQELSAAQDLQ